MFRNPVGEFSQSSRRSFRPQCEQLEERLVLDGNHMTSSMPQTADPNAFLTVVALTDVISSLNAQVAGRVLAADNGISLPAARRAQRLVSNVGGLIAALQGVEMQAVQSQASVNDPNLQFADILFRQAVDDFHTVQRVANGLEGDVLSNIVNAASAAATTKRQISNAINTGNQLKALGNNLLNQLGISH